LRQANIAIVVDCSTNMDADAYNQVGFNLKSWQVTINIWFPVDRPYRCNIWLSTSRPWQHLREHTPTGIRVSRSNRGKSDDSVCRLPIWFTWWYFAILAYGLLCANTCPLTSIIRKQCLVTITWFLGQT
jgi:hypothetical protein